ncbi:hypothetical protein DAEQUDRAFT_467182 [Daedalea quercina L-15889]|uniref:Uncharacterized protein n=1 Tax=Daedalea quercina L-15889 TaxID=1314783 RepID=A0A165TFY3_9APHY|nr:hypothetical protein DAEQUDRAFT_467182 [Daedalea quercina L-15889]
MLAKVFVFALFPFAVVNAAPIGQRDLVDSVVSRATSAVGSLWHEATHGSSSVYQSATAALGTATANVHVTSVGGPAITLATLSVPGQQGTHHSHPVATTTFAGHTFLVPSSVSHSRNSTPPFDSTTVTNISRYVLGWGFSRLICMSA